MYIGEPIALRVLGGEATRKKISFSCILEAILGPIKKNNLLFHSKFHILTIKKKV